MFQSVPGQLLIEYLLAMADLYKDEFFDKEFTDPQEALAAKQYLAGRLNVLDEVIGIPMIVKQYKKMHHED